MEQLKIKPFYNSKIDNLIEDFYNPLLSKCTNYKRVSAYFDSAIIEHYSKGIENIVKNQGKIQFIFSADISREDFEIIVNGYQEREKIYDDLANGLSFENTFYEISNLAYLIKYGYVDIKIAFTRKSGVFHDKFGLFELGDKTVYFRGSNNETVAAIKSNFESFETTASWTADNNEISKLILAQKTFNDLWNNEFDDSIYVVDVPKAIKLKIMTYDKNKLIIDWPLDSNCLIVSYENDKLIFTNNLENKNFLSRELTFYKKVLSNYLEKTENNQFYFDKELTYADIKYIVSETLLYGQNMGFIVTLMPNLKKFLLDYNIVIEKRRTLGLTIKSKHEILQKDFNEFSRIVNKEMKRELRLPQLWDAYHMANMMRSANFSVPGSGKTSIVYGAYAYLSSSEKALVNKIVVIGPLNAFSSWKDEFDNCFGDKRRLNVLDYQKIKSLPKANKYDYVVYESQDYNVMLFNYEAINSNLDILRRIIDDKTILVFDEVHRIKSIEGIRAKAALSIIDKAKYRIVLTGTPMPNGFPDLHNMLKILFSEDYDNYFGYSRRALEIANHDKNQQIEIKEKINPFYCRITKEDLRVPPAEKDDIQSGYIIANNDEIKIFELLYRHFHKNFLTLYIRLIQASSNPALLLKDINLNELVIDYHEDFYNIELGSVITRPSLSATDIELIQKVKYSSKFLKGIELIESLTSKGSVIVWGIFIDTIHSISDFLNNRKISTKVITGNTSLIERERILSEFKKGEFNVLVTNPHTLGESISLHKVCHQAVYFELSYNLVHLLQSRDRIHRLGLENNEKTYYYFMLLDSPFALYPPIDVRIYSRLKEKERLQNMLLQKDEISFIEDDIMQDIKAIIGDL